MRTIDASEEIVLNSRGRSEHLHVMISNGDGTYNDLTSLAGYNWIKSVSIRENIDEPVASAQLEIWRDRGQLSLAMLHETSKLNRPSGSYVPALRPGREIRIYAATAAWGASPIWDWPAPSRPPWHYMFWGRIDELDWSSNPIRISCRDAGGAFQDWWIEKEQAYLPHCGTTDRYPAYIWEPSLPVLSSYEEYETYEYDYCLPSCSNGYIYICTVHGTTGTTEPTWPTVIGNTVVDGTATWQCHATEDASAALEDILTAILGNTVGSVACPVSPSWMVKPFRLDRQSRLDAARNLAAMIGWDIRLKPNASEVFAMTLWQVNRSKAVADRIFGANDYTEITRLGLSLAPVRNVVRVIYEDGTHLANGVDHKRLVYQVQDDPSISTYGRRFIEIAEKSTSLIDTVGEAHALADAVLADLKDPIAEQEVTLPFFFAAELGDLYEFAANNVHYTSHVDLAVVGFEHSWQEGSATTKLICRGAPSGGCQIWHERGAAPGVAAAVPDSAPPRIDTSAITVASFVGYATVTIIPPDTGLGRGRWGMTELYVHTSSSFTPSSVTLYGRAGRTNFFTVCKAAGTYYGKIITRDRSRGESSPSNVFTIVIN